MTPALVILVLLHREPFLDACRDLGPVEARSGRVFHGPPPTIEAAVERFQAATKAKGGTVALVEHAWIGDQGDRGPLDLFIIEGRAFSCERSK